jgi:hypothetical protein
VNIGGFRITGFQSYRVTEFQSFRVTELQSYRVTELQSFRVTELQSYRVSEFQSFRPARLTYTMLKLNMIEVGQAGFQGYGVTELRGYKVQKVQGFKATDLPAAGGVAGFRWLNVVRQKRVNDVIEIRKMYRSHRVSLFQGYMVSELKV